MFRRRLSSLSHPFARAIRLLCVRGFRPLARLFLTIHRVLNSFFCVVDAYYCFEYIWVAKGLDLKERAKL